MDRLVSSSYRLDVANVKMFAAVTRRPCDRTWRFSHCRQRMPCSTEPEFPYESSNNEMFQGKTFYAWDVSLNSVHITSGLHLEIARSTICFIPGLQVGF